MKKLLIILGLVAFAALPFFGQTTYTISTDSVTAWKLRSGKKGTDLNTWFQMQNYLKSFGAESQVATNTSSANVLQAANNATLLVVKQKLDTIAQTLRAIKLKEDTIRNMYQEFTVAFTPSSAVSGTQVANSVVTTTASYTMPTGKWEIVSIISNQPSANYNLINFVSSNSAFSVTTGTVMNSASFITNILDYIPLASLSYTTPAGALTTPVNTGAAIVRKEVYSGTWYWCLLNNTNAASWNLSQPIYVRITFRRVQ